MVRALTAVASSLVFGLTLVPTPDTTTRQDPGAAAGALGQTSVPDSVLLAGYKWRNIGPDRGGPSISVSGVRGHPKEAYFGAVGGGLWKTTDAGDHSAPITDGQLKSPRVGAAAVSETNPRIPYILI